MRETDFCAAGGARNDAKRSIRLQVERLIGTEMHPCGAHDSNACLRNRSFQQRPGNVAGRVYPLQSKLQAPGHFSNPAGKMFSPLCIICQSHHAFPPTTDRGQPGVLFHDCFLPTTRSLFSDGPDGASERRIASTVWSDTWPMAARSSSF